MKCLRLKAAYAVALMLLSLVVNTNAYASGKDSLWTRASEKLTGAVANKLPPSLAKKIITGVAAASFICGAYVCGSAIFSGELPQPIKKSVDFTTSIPDRGRLAIALQGVDVDELQRKNLALDGVRIVQLNDISIDDVSILDDETSAKMQNLILMQVQNLLGGEESIVSGDVVWLELSEDNELQAFSYEHARQIDLSRAALYFVAGLAGGIIFLYSNYWFLYLKYPYPDHYPHPTISALMLWGGALLFAGGFAKVLVNLGVVLP